MRLVTPLLAIGLISLSAACGAQKGGTASPAPNTAQQTGNPATVQTPADQQKRDSTYAALPQTAVIRVPVDAQGNATGGPDMKTLGSAAALSSGAAVDAAFKTGADPKKVVASKDELDGDTSSQSWSGWSNYGSYGYGSSSYGYSSGYGYGSTSTYGNTNAYGYGCGSYCSGWNTSYWQNSYSPTVYWQGYGWNYGYANTYSYGGYNYYCYSPRRSW